MTDAQRRRDRLVRLASFALVTLVGLWLLWPIPLGHAPLSKDHTVHITRIWAWAHELQQGAPRGWSEVWFFGTPIGEVYPVLGDALVVAIRTLALGLLDWHQAYALGFTVVFVSQGWAMLRLGRLCDAGPLVGPIAALLLLCDAGAYREGGWIYTVDYGVWPQALANTLTWLALGEIVVAARSADTRARGAALARAALCIGGALLSHQITLLVLALCLPLLLAVGLRDRARFGATAVAAGLALVLGVAIAAWWVVPMGAVRMWMVSYGWLWQPLSWMLDEATRGHLTQGMPMGVSVLIAVGIVAVALRGRDTARMLVACGVLLWLWTAEDTLWRLRLDLLSAAFGQMQWQRFLIAAKPGLMLAGGCAVGLASEHAIAAWRSGGALRAAAAALALAAAALVGWAARDGARAMTRAQVGTPLVRYDPDDATLDQDYAALAAWLTAARQQDHAPRWRVLVAAPRNQHWFMDMPVRTGLAMYKAGFTPGDNFVHKPEADTPALLDALGVRYVVTRRRGGVREARLVERFGKLELYERKRWQPRDSAHLHGPGTITMVHDDPDGGRVELDIAGAGPDTQLVFDIAGYPRWSLEHDGAPVEWVETPAVGDGPDATQAERRSGALRGGKADGDDGSEPTLLAAPAADGRWVLRYRTWTARDGIAMIVSVLALAIAALLLRPHRRFDPAARLEPWFQRLGGDGTAAVRGWIRPWMFAAAVALALAVWLVRTRAGLATERAQALGWLDRGDAEVRVAQGTVTTGPLKTDMLVHPAILVLRPPARARGDAEPPRRAPATIRFDHVALGQRLTGWFALDDDAAKMRPEGKHRLVIEARASGGDDQRPWTVLFDEPVRHVPGRQWLALPTDVVADTVAQLRVTVHSEGAAPPELGFDLDLGAPPS
ncbi:MAG: hypothetical protein U0168_08135 [Nannocystaceae bacterium]